MKRIIAIIISVCFACCSLAACGENKEDDAVITTEAVTETDAPKTTSAGDDDPGDNDVELDDDVNAGNWFVNKSLTANKLPEGMESVFEEAVEGLDGASYKPIVYLGSQEDEGESEYAFLCKQVLTTNPPLTKLAVVFVENEPGSGIMLDDVEELDLYKTLNGNADRTDKEDMQEWTINSEFYPMEIDEEKKELYENAVKGSVLENSTLIALLGECELEQPQSAFLAATNENDLVTYSIVYVESNPEEGAQILQTVALHPENF